MHIFLQLQFKSQLIVLNFRNRAISYQHTELSILFQNRNAKSQSKTKFNTVKLFILFIRRFNDLKQYILHPENTVTILVGTKCHSTPQERKVDRVKAETLADHLEIQYMEVSSEEDINIKKLFETVTTDIIETFKKKPEDQIQQDKTYLLGIQDRNNNTENTKCSCW